MEVRWKPHRRSASSWWPTARRPRTDCWRRWPAGARRGPCEFALLIPDVGDRKQADWTLENALPLLRRAAGGPVEGILGGADPFTSVRDTVRDGHFDEIIVSTLPKKTSKWLRRDLVRKIESLGLPVTTVTPTQQSLRDAVEDSDDVTRGLVLGGGGGG